jgi:hypothetical protein
VLLELDVDRHDGVDAKEEVGAGIEPHAGVHGAARHPVNVVLPVDLNGGVQAGKRGGRLDGRRDGHVVLPGLDEDRDVGGVEVHGHDVQFPLQPAKVVGAAPGGESLGEKALQRGIGEEARGH